MKEYLVRAKGLINQRSVSLVSFDVFDTLLTMPAVNPDDLLQCVCNRILMDDGTDVYADRMDEAKKHALLCTTLEEIWYNIAQKHQKGLDTAIRWAGLELSFVQQIVANRTIGQQLYEFAVAQGKRVVAVSNMYIPEYEMLKLLHNKGYKNISAIYVSCSRRKIKQTGELFFEMLDNEHVSADKVVHIGDSTKADLIGAQNAGIIALRIPGDVRLMTDRFRCEQLMTCFQEFSYESILYGYVIHQLAEITGFQNTYFSPDIYTHLIVFPMLMHVALDLLHAPDIQNGYNQIHFSSRDGYLVMHAYKRLQQFFPHTLQANYLLASRIACRVLLEDHFIDQFQARYIHASCTLIEFLDHTVTDNGIKHMLHDELTSEEKNTLVKNNIKACIAILAPYHEALETMFQVQKKATFQYYIDAFGSSDRVLFADCGFSGTIPGYLMRGFCGKHRIDKAFFWDTEKNRFLDDITGTQTHVAFTKKRGHCLAPMVETTFSEVGESCIGFTFSNRGHIEPVFEDSWIPQDMIIDIQMIQKQTMHLVDGFCNTFGEWTATLVPKTSQAVMLFVQSFLSDKDSDAPVIFRNIRFKENYANQMTSENLSEMMIQRNKKDG